MTLLPMDPLSARAGMGRGLFGRLGAPAALTDAEALPAAPVGGGMMFRGTTPAAPPVATTMPRDWDLSATDASVREGIANARKPGFFDSNGLGLKLLKGVGDFAVNMSASQGDPGSMAFLQNRMAMERQRSGWQRDDAQRAQDREWQLADAEAKANAPDYFMSGRDRIRYDPRTGTATTVYDGAEDFETFAQAMGFEPGTDEYRTAAQDFVLRGNGPTAYGFDVALEGERQAGRERMEGVRQGNRLALRTAPTYRDLNPRAPASRGGGGSGRAPTLAGTVAPILAKVARGQSLTPAEQQAWSMYRQPSGRGRTGAGSSFSRVAQDAKGNKVGWNGSAWVPIK